MLHSELFPSEIFLAGHLHVTMEHRILGGALSLGAGTLSLRLRGEAASFLMIERISETAINLTRYAIEDGQCVKARADTLELA